MNSCWRRVDGLKWIWHATVLGLESEQAVQVLKRGEVWSRRKGKLDDPCQAGRGFALLCLLADGLIG
jgi:hypothetical protein